MRASMFVIPCDPHDLGAKLVGRTELDPDQQLIEREEPIPEREPEAL